MFSRFWRESIKRPSFQTLVNFRYYGAWLDKLNERGGLDDGVPWLAFGAITKLRSHVKPGMKVFEYGAGGSTTFFLKNGLEVITVEHEREWEKMVQEKVNKDFPHASFKMYLVEPQKFTGKITEGMAKDPAKFLSINSLPGRKYEGLSFEDYVRSIEQYEKKSFDIIVIDGRSRPACFEVAKDYLKNEGLIVYDNTDRDYYLGNVDTSGFRIETIYGPCPYNEYFTETSLLWKK